MGLVIYLVIMWMVLTVFFSLKNKLPNAINIILFLVVQMIHLNIFTIASFKLKWFTVSTSPVKFLTILIQRDVLVPILLLLFVNILFSAKQVSKRMVITVVIFIILASTEKLLRVLGYSHDHHWSISLFCMGMMGISTLTAIGLMKLWPRGNKGYDGLSNR